MKSFLRKSQTSVLTFCVIFIIAGGIILYAISNLSYAVVILLPNSTLQSPVDKLTNLNASTSSIIGSFPYSTTQGFGIDPDMIVVPPERRLVGRPTSSLVLTSTDLLIADIAVEADYEFYLKFGSKGDAENYIRALFSDISSIYERDINVRLRSTFIRVWDTPSDPWSATNTSAALNELQSYWNTNETARSRAFVVFLSGKSLGGGIAYVGAVCDSKWGANSSYDYGVAGNMQGYYSAAPGPNTWDLVVVAHEIGHAFNSMHSHCYHRTNNPTTWYDMCYATESSCYSGTAVASSGTVMSYCHTTGNGMSAINPLSFTDGDPAMVNVMRSFAESVSVSSSNYGCLKVENKRFVPNTQKNLSANW